MSNDRLKLVAELLRAIDADQAAPEPEQKTPELPRMRTIPAAVAEIRTADPETALTVTALRRAVKQGKIPFVEINTKRLVNLADVYAYMSSSAAVPERSTATMYGIRKVM